VILTERKNKRFPKQQKARNKDVERAFVVLQARWVIVRHPARRWNLQTMWEVITYVVMHNMIVEQEHDDTLHDQG
jgi:hypothetical protein